MKSRILLDRYTNDYYSVRWHIIIFLLLEVFKANFNALYSPLMSGLVSLQFTWHPYSTWKVHCTKTASTEEGRTIVKFSSSVPEAQPQLDLICSEFATCPRRLELSLYDPSCSTSIRKVGFPARCVSTQSQN